MGVSLKLANVWRVIREVDLQAIRLAAQAPFELWAIDDGRIQAESIRTWLAGDAPLLPSVRVVHGADLALADTVLPAAALVIADVSTATQRPTSATPGLVGEDSQAVVRVAPEAIATLSPAIDLNPMLGRLRKGRVPTIVVITGQAREDDRLVSATERHLHVPTLDDESARKRIAAALVEIVPGDLRLALARQLPPLRPCVFDRIIDETARANASYALTSGLAEVVPLLTVPLNLGDMVVLTKNQLVMSYRLVLAAGRDGEPRALLREILGVLGGGLLFRQLARQLVGLIPVAGIVPKVAIAYGGTWSIGRAIVLWVTEGREVTADLVRNLSTEGLQRGRAVATRLIEQTRTQTDRASRRWERLKAQLPRVGRRRS